MKRLTKAEKMIRGTFEASKIKKPLNFLPLETVPEPMMKLHPVEMEYYQLCAECMVGNNTLTSADLPGLTRAAKMYGIFQQALKDIEKNGCYQVAKSGYNSPNAYFMVLINSEKMLTAWERSQGLNLVSRSKLPEPPPPPEINPFDEFLDHGTN
jgi:phage terminase small subunit